jgi:hypothetical protein
VGLHQRGVARSRDGDGEMSRQRRKGLDPAAIVNRNENAASTLGPADGADDRVQVGVNGFVACLGANSLTYLVQRTGGGWVVGGIAAYGPVA